MHPNGALVRVTNGTDAPFARCDTLLLVSRYFSFSFCLFLFPSGFLIVNSFYYLACLLCSLFQILLGSLGFFFISFRMFIKLILNSWALF